MPAKTFNILILILLFSLTGYSQNTIGLPDIINYNKTNYNAGLQNWDIKQDKNGIIWIASSNEGFYSFNPATEKFVHFRHEQNDENSLSADEISGLEIDKSGIIWLATQNGLDAFDPTKNSFKHFVHHDDDTSSITSNSIGIDRGVALLIDDDDNLWLTFASADVDVFNTIAGKVVKHFHFTAISGPMEVWPSGPRPSRVMSNSGRAGSSTVAP